jgi:hypothetical protein
VGAILRCLPAIGGFADSAASTSCQFRARPPRWRALSIAGTLEAMDSHLREIIDRGGRAQSAEAARLLIRLESNPDDAEARSMARVLVDAYLNDPDLTR